MPSWITILLILMGAVVNLGLICYIVLCLFSSRARRLVLVGESRIGRWFTVFGLVVFSSMLLLILVDEGRKWSYVTEYTLTAQGTIVKIQNEQALVCFVSQEGQKLKFPSPLSDNSSCYEVGQDVTVFYIPFLPAHAEVRDFNHSGGYVLLSFVGFTVFSSVTVLYMLAMIGNRRRRRGEFTIRWTGMSDRL